MSESPFKLPPAVAAVWTKVRGFFVGLSKPARVLLVTGILSAVAIVGYFAVRGAYEPYAVLYASLDRDDAAALVAKLKEMKVPYRLGTDGSSIEVPPGRVQELRLELATMGLPRGGGVGFESFDKMRLGATEFEQRVLYKRSLEGELSRTITSISSIQSARVHLVLPEKSLFVSKSEPATASIVVKVKPGKTLTPQEVNGIVHLTASSVPGLTSNEITLVTTDGTALHRAKRRDPGQAEAETNEPSQATASQALESSLEERTRSILEKVVGTGHVDVRVSALFDSARVERVEDHYDPVKTALRSEERSIDRSSQASDTVAGVPGAESNLPQGAPAKTGESSVTTNRESYTRNFEVDHVQEKRTVTAATLKRLTVAVIVDGVRKDGVTVPRTREELDKLEAIVRGAVGADEKRGDLVSIQSTPFSDRDVETATDAPAPVASRFEVPAKWRKPLLIAGAGLLVMLGIVAAIRAKRRKRQKAADPARQDAEVLLAPTPVIRELSEPVDFTKEAFARAAQDPATAAMVLRAWLGTAEGTADVNAAVPAPKEAAGARLAS